MSLAPPWVLAWRQTADELSYATCAHRHPQRAKAEAEAEADAAKREVARLQRMVEALRSEAAEGGKGVSQAAFDQLRSER